MKSSFSYFWQKTARLGTAVVLGISLCALAIFGLRWTVPTTYADPIDPPEGYPKLSLSLKTVTPTLASTTGETLYYTIEILNTGAYQAENATLVDAIPANTTYNDDAVASDGSAVSFSGGELSWTGDVPFDSRVVISFSVDVDAAYEGTISNEALIDHDSLDDPVIVTAETIVTDDPIFEIGKTAVPAKPGANNTLTYTLIVSNVGQPVSNYEITVEDIVPNDTVLNSVGDDGTAGPGNNSVEWTRPISLDFGETTVFTFSVDIGDVPSGTIITNDDYSVDSVSTTLTAGAPYTTTVLDPIFTLDKQIDPEPAGSNGELTYILTLLNTGSLATDIVITDQMPLSVTYVSGGVLAGDVVSWTIPSLDTGETAEVTYTVYIDDIAEVGIVNELYEACSAEGICEQGDVITSVVGAPTFRTTAVLDPIAKKPGGGGGPVTPTMTVENIGPGNGLDVNVYLEFGRISVQGSDIQVIPSFGTIMAGPDCGDKCSAYVWTGDIAVGELITFTTFDPQSTIGGEEGTNYTATIVVTDSLANYVTEPLSSTAVGRITHLANLVPYKEAPAAIGRGQLMTYTIEIWNSALSTDAPPFPWVTDTVPMSTTLVRINGDGISNTISGSTTVSWTLPSMSPGDRVYRSYVVRIDDDLVSGTQIVNEDYRASWFEIEEGKVFSNTGEPVTTTVKDIGLIDSFKVVTPALALPGSNNVLTFHLHIVNSAPYTLDNVSLYDYLPWENSTYQRDAVASAGEVISDIVSMQWHGSVGAFSEEVITLTVHVDPGYKGAITNTAVITHADLLEEVTVEAVAYITDEPELQISKSASPDPASVEGELRYTIIVRNLGQQATNLVVTDTIPADTTYVMNSASGNGKLLGDEVTWETPVLETGESRTYTFRVTVGNVAEVVNAFYGVTSAEGASAIGQPVTTQVSKITNDLYLPIVVHTQ